MPAREINKEAGKFKGAKYAYEYSRKYRAGKPGKLESVACLAEWCNPGKVEHTLQLIHGAKLLPREVEEKWMLIIKSELEGCPEFEYGWTVKDEFTIIWPKNTSGTFILFSGTIIRILSESAWFAEEALKKKGTFLDRTEEAFTENYHWQYMYGFGHSWLSSKYSWPKDILLNEAYKFFKKTRTYPRWDATREYCDAYASEIAKNRISRPEQSVLRPEHIHLVDKRHENVYARTDDILGRDRYLQHNLRAETKVFEYA